MSAAAIQPPDQLRESGVENDRAVKIAEAFDLRVKEALEEAKTHSDRNRAEAEARADRNRAESEAQAKTQFVTADEYHKRDKTLATREDLNAAIAAVHTAITALRAEFRAEMAEVRADNRATNRLILGGFVTLTAGIVALVAKLFIGV